MNCKQGAGRKAADIIEQASRAIQKAETIEQLMRLEEALRSGCLLDELRVNGKSKGKRQ